MASRPSRRESRAELSKATRPEDFRDFYWLKQELQGFCRAQGLATSGGKREIAERIEHYLRTGQRLRAATRPALETAAARRVNATPAAALAMTTRAPAGFRCTQEARQFFERHLGKRFRFTVPLQDFIKAHPGVSFRQIADEWQRQDALRRAGAWRPEIAPQFEYNQFTRDYHADPRNQGKTHRDCLEAWNRVRARRGEHKYRPSR